MTSTAHSLVGAAIAAKLGNPVLAIPLVFASHFLLDCVPHWDTGTSWHDRPKKVTFVYSALDVFLGIGLSLLLFAPGVNPLYLLLMIFISTLPDWLQSPYIFWNIKLPPFYWFYKLQSKLNSKDGSWFGIATQLVIVIPLLLWAKL